MPLLNSINRTLRVNRFNRRLLIAATFAGYPLVLVGYSTLVVTNRISTLAWAPIAIVLTAITAIGLLLIYRFVKDRAQLNNGRLDERERQLTARAYVLSYSVLATVVVLLAGALAIVLSFSGPVTLQMGDLAPWLITLGVFLPALPSAALAWIEPEAIDEEVRA